ncbi:MAG: class I SAM-dependent methyltransferase [Syntrophomonadaceae bacterium]|mgnify:CR=1 FL=1|nr:class I SAM-dependent methyltransferase [Syntrophomonadaceae bacterium]
MDMRSILSSPSIYRLFSTIVGQGPARDIYVEKLIRPNPGERILDIGCGPGDIVEHLPENIDYVGFDMSQVYIDAAVKRFGYRATFMRRYLNDEVLRELEPFDVVIAIGVIHHLNDQEADSLFKVASAALKPGGRVLTVDPVFYTGQPLLERWLVSKDRGEYVRYDERYPKLIPSDFSTVRTTKYKGLLRIPYSLFFMECYKE